MAKLAYTRLAYIGPGGCRALVPGAKLPCCDVWQEVGYSSSGRILWRRCYHNRHRHYTRGQVGKMLAGLRGAYTAIPRRKRSKLRGQLKLAFAGVSGRVICTLA